MTFENELDCVKERELLYGDVTYQIRGACFWVWKEFKGAHKEVIVDRALTQELKKRGLKVDDQKRIDIYYDDKKIGTYIPDKIVNDCVLLEIKRKSFLVTADYEQFWRYLKASPYRLGMLINFSDKELQIKRVVYDRKRDLDNSNES